MILSVLPRDTLLNGPFWAVLGVAILASASDVGHAAEPPPGAAILQQLRSFATMGSVLYVAAHPDDENTQAITYLARGRGYRTAYLSLTRGDGGQNLLGPQLGEALGVARTQELLAARRLDGGRQYFTRAKDFGFSKNSEETLSVWDRQSVLSDMVRVIREFRPDVIITRFSPEPAPTHGHHTASGRRHGRRGLARERAGWSGRGEGRGRRPGSGIGRVVRVDRRPKPGHAQDAGVRQRRPARERGLADRAIRATRR
jgi:hypothetical protein